MKKEILLGLLVLFLIGCQSESSNFYKELADSIVFCNISESTKAFNETLIECGDTYCKPLFLEDNESRTEKRGYEILECFELCNIKATIVAQESC